MSNLIWFCFNYSTEDIKQDYFRNGHSTIIEKIRLTVITNMARDNKEKNAGRIVQIVAEKYLTIQSTELCSVSYDRQIRAMVSDMAPLINLDQSSHAFADIYEIATKLLGD